jgi:hypothetical protein
LFKPKSLEQRYCEPFLTDYVVTLAQITYTAKGDDTAARLRGLRLHELMLSHAQENRFRASFVMPGEPDSRGDPTR